jgi:archaellum component FlaG (FlaF/FlaG flagellin family)
VKKSLLYISIGLLVVSSLFVSGAMADNIAPLIQPLIPETKMVSSGYGVSSAPAYAGDAAIYPYGEMSKIVVKPSYSNIRLQPGESREIKVTVSNRGEETASIDPTMVIQPYTENYLKEEWVTVTPQNFELAPDSKQQFIVKISIPEDADLGYYYASMVFGEFDAQNYTTYPVYGGSLEMSVDVWTIPNVQIETTYLNDRVEAGGSYDYQVNITNVGKEDLAMDPEVLVNGIYYAEAVSSIRYDAAAYGVMIDESAITVDAPSIIKAGETVTVKVHLDVPENATGSFSGTIDLNIDDPALRDWEGQVQLYFIVWEQPSEPFIKEFTTYTNGTMRIEISTSVYNSGFYGGSTSDSLSPSFEVSMNQEGRKVNMKLVRSTTSGSVSYGSNHVQPLISSASYDYRSTGTIYTEVYEVSGAPGKWTLSILPSDTDNFEYSITTGDQE